MGGAEMRELMMMRLLTSLVEKKTDNGNCADRRHDQEKPTYLCHSDLPPTPCLINNNSYGEKNQCENDTKQSFRENKRLAGDDPNDKDRKGDLAAVIEESGHILPRTRIHGQKTLSKGPEDVKMNLQKNYYEKSRISMRPSLFSAVLLMLMAGFLFLPAGVSFARVEATGVEGAPKTPAASEQKQASPPSQNVLISKEIVTVSPKEKENREGEGLARTKTSKKGKEKEKPAEEKKTSDSAALSLVSKEEIPPSPEPVKMVMKTFSGEVSAKGPNGIAIVYEKNAEERWSKEYWFPFEDEIKLLGYRSLKDISEGDKVTVGYEEAEDGSQRILKRIALSKKAPREIEEQPEPEEEDILASRGEDAR